ncbi:MAG: thioredoxin domain-containing protein [Haloarculaceae archaeon]
MDESTGAGGAATRRAFLAGAGGTALAGLAGCLGSTGKVDTKSAVTPGGDGTLPVPVAGDPNADVTVMAFEDFACPHCEEYSVNVAPEIFSQYVDPGKVRYEFYDFPIPVDKQVSWQAASAARAVQKRQGDAAFFDYAHALYEHQSSLGPSEYATLANQLGFEGSAVKKAAVNETYRDTVSKYRKYGKKIGVRGTPTIVVDGKAVKQTASAISDAIDQALSTTTTQ